MTLIRPPAVQVRLGVSRDASWAATAWAAWDVACFVPVGGFEEGPPHASRRMHAEFEVV